MFLGFATLIALFYYYPNEKKTILRNPWWEVNNKNQGSIYNYCYHLYIIFSLGINW